MLIGAGGDVVMKEEMLRAPRRPPSDDTQRLLPSSLSSEISLPYLRIDTLTLSIHSNRSKHLVRYNSEGLDFDLLLN
jgi:hypothetical protein